MNNNEIDLNNTNRQKMKGKISYQNEDHQKAKDFIDEGHAYRCEFQAQTQRQQPGSSK